MKKAAKKQFFKYQSNTGLNPSNPEYLEKMRSGAFQRDPEGNKYQGSEEAAKAKNVWNNFK
jgi:hypothetical protein